MAKRGVSKSKSAMNVVPYSRIQTAEGWKRSQMRKHKSSKVAGKG